jgi:hypothetical protein
MYYRTIHYYCPYCEKEQFFFTFKPNTTDRWRCRKCRKKFRLDAGGIAATWASAIGLWSMPVAYPVAVLAITLAAPPGELPAAILGGLFCAGPVAMLCSLLIFAIIGLLIGYVYALTAVKK